MKNRTIGRYKLFIFDGHGSYVTPEFDQFYFDHSIIVFYIPTYSFYLLQPFDINCFSVFKHSYRRFVENSINLGTNHIDKQDFLLFYQKARLEALHEKNIESGFAATGFVPYEPNRVLSLLHVQFHPASPELYPQIQCNV